MKEFDSIEEAERKLIGNEIKDIKMSRRVRDGKLYLSKIYLKINGEIYVICNSHTDEEYSDRIKLFKDDKIPGKNKKL